MATIKELSKGRKDINYLDPKDIQREDGWNARFNLERKRLHIDELKTSIREIGVKQPLTLYMKEGVPTLTDGDCRLTAVQELIAEGAEIKLVPVIMEERHANDADRTLSLLTRNMGMPLEMAEKAVVVKRLLGYGWDKAQIAKKAGMSLSGLENLLVYCSAPAAVQTMVENGEVSASMAVETVKQHKEAATEVLTEAVKVAKSKGKKKATKTDVQKVSKETRYYTMGAGAVIAELISKGRDLDIEEMVSEAGLDLSLAEDDDKQIIFEAYPNLYKENK